MVAYAVQSSQKGKSVIVATSNLDLHARIQGLLRALVSAIPNVYHYHLSEIQGREADYIVFDLHDVALAATKPDEALRYVIILLGRARITTSIVIGKRNGITSVPEAALPVEVFMGVLLQYRVRSRETRVVQRSGMQFALFSKDYILSQLDESTIRVWSLHGLTSDLVLVKDRRSHNASMMNGLCCMIEAPAFFESDTVIEREVGIIGSLLRGGVLPNLRINSFEQVGDFLAQKSNPSSKNDD